MNLLQKVCKNTQTKQRKFLRRYEEHVSPITKIKRIRAMKTKREIL